MNAPLPRLSGGFSEPSHDSARGFRAILNAMARPGTQQVLRGGHGPAPISGAAASALLVLCDRTTPLHLAASHDNAELRDWIAFHCAAPLVPAEEAQFALGDWDALLPLDRFQMGDPEYPDRAAMLIVDRHDFTGMVARLRGPGIKGQTELALPDPAEFARNHARFPLGWDVILTAGDKVAALPRSTEVF